MIRTRCAERPAPHALARRAGVLAVLAAGILGVLAGTIACEPAPTLESRPPAPAGLRATVVIEPPHIEIGETARVELAVVTPPGQQVAPVAPPEDLEGIWVLATESPTVERAASRWVHRMHYQVRAKATGRFSWPAQQVVVRAADGTKLTVETAERPFEIAEISPEYPGQRSFFSFRTLEPVGSERRPWLPALAGALAALASVALVALVRRARQAEHVHEERGADSRARAIDPSARGSSLAALASARELSATDPLRSADMASGALRRYGARRYALPMLSCTTEELAEASPPLSLGDRWSDWLQVLRDLDGVRFLPRDSGRAATVEETIDRALALISEGAPGGAPR